MCCKSTKKRELGHKNRWIYFVRLPTFRIFVIIFVMKPRNTRTDMDRQPLLTYYDLDPDVTAFSTTRHGGWSRGNYASLNINSYCGDNPDDVERNRLSLCRLLAVEDDKLVVPHQVHQTRVADINDAFFSLDRDGRATALEGVDAVMTSLPKVCIGVSTADCIPLLLFDDVQRVACAIHAGWRGTVARISQVAVDEMRRVYGCHAEHMRAQIGPGISLDSFEVGDEVYEAFRQAGFEMGVISRRQPSNNEEGSKWHIDLPECNRQQLLAAGLLPERVSSSEVCTYLHHDTYFSARRLGISSGRIYTGIIIGER